MNLSEAKQHPFWRIIAFLNSVDEERRGPFAVNCTFFFPLWSLAAFDKAEIDGLSCCCRVAARSPCTLLRPECFLLLWPGLCRVRCFRASFPLSEGSWHPGRSAEVKAQCISDGNSAADAVRQLQTGSASSHHLRIKGVYLNSHRDYKSD